MSLVHQDLWGRLWLEVANVLAAAVRGAQFSHRHDGPYFRAEEGGEGTD